MHSDLQNGKIDGVILEDVFSPQLVHEYCGIVKLDGSLGKINYVLFSSPAISDRTKA